MTSSNQHEPSVVPPHAKKGDIEFPPTALHKQTHVREMEKKK